MNESTNQAPEFGSRPEDIAAFNEAIDAINTHNQQFGLGRLLARAVVDSAKQALRADELIGAGATPEEAEQVAAFVGSEQVLLTEEEQMARSVVGMVNASALEAIGLILSPLRSTATMYSDQGEQSVGEVRLQVTDGGKLSGFLLAINPEFADKAFQDRVTYVVDNLISETSDALATNQDEQTVPETLAYASGIVTGLEHVGLGEAPVTKRLHDLAEHAKQGDAKEYVLAERTGLLTSPEEQTFGPSQWQKDSTAQGLTERWGNILSILKLAQDNPNAQQLFGELLAAAQTNLDIAMADWNEHKTPNHDGTGYGSGFDEAFQTVALELKLLASPDEEAQ
jgi:hypothetical protein